MSERARLEGLRLWYAAVRADWTCPPHLIGTDDNVEWKRSARAWLARRRKR